jgi:hypothetical protein
MMPAMPVAESCVVMAGQQSLSKPRDLPSMRVSRQREIDTGIRGLAKEIRVVRQQNRRFIVAQSLQRSLEVRLALREVVDSRNPYRIGSSVQAQAAIPQRNDAGLLYDTAEVHQVGLRIVVVVARDSHHSFTSSQRSESRAQPLNFVTLLIDKIAGEANEVGWPRGDLRCQFSKFRIREKESDVKVAQERQAEAIQTRAASREFNLDGAKVAGAAQNSTQHLAGRRVLEWPDKTRDKTPERT